MQDSTLTGFLLINKPKDISSFDCIRKLKKLLPKKTKIGHTGTLDNFATGLLIICVGRQATKFVRSFMNLDKEYVVKAKLGELTDTLDHTGTIVETIDNVSVTRNDLLNAIKSLGCKYVQIPPAYSALKHEGQPLYKLARHKKISKEELDKIVKHKAREVQLYEVELLDVEVPFFSFRARVTKGTYVRSLANDIAQQCGLCATTYELTRTKIGEGCLEQAIDLDQINSFEDVETNILSLNEIQVKLGV